MREGLVRTAAAVRRFVAAFVRQPLGAQFVAAAIVAATAAVAVNLVVEGPMRWHFTQPAAIEGMAEVLALACVLAFVLLLRAGSRWRLVWLVVPVAIYLRRHHVDAPALVALLYLEFILALGVVASKLLRTPADPDDPEPWLLRLLAGLAAWSLLLWVLQAAELGQPRAARMLFVLLLVPVFVLARVRPLCAVLTQRALTATTPERWAAASSIAFACLLFARTNSFAGHDALWYGFRPEQVLIGATSVFDPTGLVSPVYYFPKLYEVLLLPLSAMGDFSFVGGFTILVAGLLVLLARRLLLARGASGSVAALLALVLATTPALANTALTPKPDVLAALAVLAMVWHLDRLARSPARTNHFGLLVCWAGVAALSKLNLLPYVAALGMAGMFMLSRALRAVPAPAAWAAVRPTVPLFLLLALVGVAITARTWWLTGVPTVAPEQLVQLWSMLGMELAAPVGTLQWVHPQEWSDAPELAFDWLFRPARLPHIIITWAGNLWFVLPLAVLFVGARARAIPRDRPTVPWGEAIVIVVGLVLLFGIRYHYRGSDGNYFIAPVAAALVVVGGVLARRAQNLLRAPSFLFAMVLAILFHAHYALVSAGWGDPGTRALDLAFTRSAWDTRDTRAHSLHAIGLAEIGEYLHRSGRGWHVVGDAPEPEAFWLPARFESVLSISFARADLLDPPGRLHEYLACAHVQAVILPTSGDSIFAVQLSKLGLQTGPGTALVAGDRYALIDVRGLAAAYRGSCPGYRHAAVRRP